jgi:hypothetical protein
MHFTFFVKWVGNLNTQPAALLPDGPSLRFFLEQGWDTTKPLRADSERLAPPQVAIGPTAGGPSSQIGRFSPTR